jgi:hypothetical protein
VLRRMQCGNRRAWGTRSMVQAHAWALTERQAPCTYHNRELSNLLPTPHQPKGKQRHPPSHSSAAHLVRLQVVLACREALGLAPHLQVGVPAAAVVGGAFVGDVGDAPAGQYGSGAWGPRAEQGQARSAGQPYAGTRGELVAFACNTFQTGLMQQRACGQCAGGSAARSSGRALVSAARVVAGAAWAGALGIKLGDGQALVDVQARLPEGGSGGGGARCQACSVCQGLWKRSGADWVG